MRLWAILIGVLLAEVSAQGSSDYLTLEATCSPSTDEILVSLKTSEPFEGLFYSRNHPSSCRVAGQRELETGMILSGEERCGVVVTGPG